MVPLWTPTNPHSLLMLLLFHLEAPRPLPTIWRCRPSQIVGHFVRTPIFFNFFLGQKVHQEFFPPSGIVIIRLRACADLSLNFQNSGNVLIRMPPLARKACTFSVCSPRLRTVCIRTVKGKKVSKRKSKVRIWPDDGTRKKCETNPRNKMKILELLQIFLRRILFKLLMMNFYAETWRYFRTLQSISHRPFRWLWTVGRTAIFSPIAIEATTYGEVMTDGARCITMIIFETEEEKVWGFGGGRRGSPARWKFHCSKSLMSERADFTIRNPPPFCFSSDGGTSYPLA